MPARLKVGLAVAGWVLLVVCNLAYARAQGCTPLDLFVQGLNWLREHPLGPAVYLALYVLRPVALLPASVLSIAAGCCFGLGWGLFWAFLGGTVAAAAGYGVGYWLGLPQRQPVWADKPLRVMRSYGLTSIVLLRWCFLPYDVVSYLGGALRFPLLGFLAASLFGNLPGTTSCVLLGASLKLPWHGGFPTPDLRLQLVSGLCFALMLWIGKRVKQRLALAPHGGSAPLSGE